MRHQVFGRKLSRDINARKALLINLTSALFENGKITTTLSKAKFAKSYAEKLVTNAKKNRLHTKRVLASNLSAKAFARLTGEISRGFTNRVGGYTRIVKLGTRLGDRAEMARLELLQWEAPTPKKTAKKVTKDKKSKTNEKRQTKSN